MSKSRCLIHAEKYERLEATVKEMSTPYHSASDFIHKHVEEVLEQYDKWVKDEEQHGKGQRKRD